MKTMNTIYTNFAKRVFFLLFTLIIGGGSALGATWTWTASNVNELGSNTSNAITLNGKEWTTNRSSGTNQNQLQSSCIQIGASGAAQTITLKSNAFTGKILSVAVECASYQSYHSVAISVGGTSYLSATPTPKWTTVGSKEGTGESSGEIQISFTKNNSSARALYLKSITIEYDESSTEDDEPVYSCGWVATDINNISSTDLVVITMTNSSGTYAMSNDKETSAAPSAKQVTVLDNILDCDIDDNIKWNVSNNDGTLTIYPNGKNDIWLYCTNTNNGVRVGTNANKTFKIDATSGYLFHNGTSRYIGVYNSQDWRCYTTVHDNIKNQTLKFYKYVPCGPTETTITLHPNGGTPNENQEITTEEESYTLPECPFSHTGYTFDGWATSANDNVIYENKETIENLNGTAVNLYAKWTPIDHEITYELYGGTNHASNPAKYTIETSTITLQAPTKTGYTFGGWYKENTFETSVTQITNGSTGDITLYAKWEVDTYRITLDANGGVFTKNGNTSEKIEVDYVYGTYPTYDDAQLIVDYLSENNITLEKRGYNLKEMWTSSGSPWKRIYTETDNRTITAQWEEKQLINFRTLCTYDIVLKNNYVDDDSKDGHTTITATHTSFSTANKPAAREGYEIEGYYLEPECTNKVADDQGKLVANVTDYTDETCKWIGSDETLYTKWTPNEYTITLDANGGTGNTESINATYNSASLSSITNPTKMGYTFAGWYSGEGGTGILVINTEGLLQANVDGYTGDEGVWTAIENKTLYAQWTPISYTIKWVVNGDTENPYATTNVEGDGALVLPAAPAAPSACSGKVFVGWTEATTVNKNGKDIVWVNTSTIPYDNKTYHAVFADEEELSIAGGDMSTKLPVGWTKQGTEQYDKNGVKFNDVNDYIFSPALGYKDLRLKIRAGYNGSEGSVLTFYAYKEDNSLFVDDEIEITPSTLVPNETYTKQNTIHEIQISANEPVKTVWIKMTSKVSVVGMEYCEIFSPYSDYTTTCEYSPEIHITGDPIQITAAKGVWVQAASALTVTGAFLTSNEHSANVSIRAYTDNTAFQIKTGGATGEGAAKGAADNALSLATNVDTDDWTGAIDVVYKPTQAGITETATLTVEVYRYGGSTVYTTNTYELQGRSLPEQFVIAVTNGSGNWFAVPADMTAPWGLGTHVPYPITVDNTTTPTVATNVSPQVIYQAAARTGNVNTNPQTMSYKSVPLASKGNYYLYGSKTSGSEPNTNIQTASFASSEQQKWFLDVVDWNTKQYNMHLHGDLTTNVLAYTTAGGANRVGQYAPESGTTKKAVYLLPIGGEIEGDLMDIVDWNTNSITINMNGYTISPSISYAVNGGASNTLAPENQNTRYSFQHVYDRTYDIATPALTPGEYLQLSVTMGSDHSNQYYQVPYIYSGNHTLPTTLTRYDQVVVRDGCLTIEGEVQVNAIYVYPTAELRIAEGTTLTANKIYMRTNAFQSAVLTDNGTINVGQFYYTRIVADKQNSFLLALPFQSAIADMRLSTGETKTYNKQWVLYTYDAAQRAETGATGNNWVKASALTHIQPHTSYELLSGSAYYREYCFPVTYNKVDEVAIPITAYTGAAAQANPIHGGWNAIASPYTHNFEPQWGGEPENAIKLTRLLDDNKTYYQYVPTIIEPATAFYYQTAQNATLQFTPTTLALQVPQAIAAKVAQREETDYPTQWISLSLTKQNQTQDETHIYVHPNKFDVAYETNYDLTKMMGYGNRAQCYTTMPCGKLSFNALPSQVAANGVSVGVYAPMNDSLTIAVKQNEYIQNVEQILLQDHYTNQTTDLLNTPYSFVAQPGEDEERFTIFIKCSATAITTDNAAQHNSQAYAYTQPKKLFLANLPRGGNIVIYDAIGKQLIQQRITQTLMDFVLPTGNYYVKVVNESGIQIIPTIVK